MATPVFESISSAGSGGTTDSISIATPLGTVDGDLLLASMLVRRNGSPVLASQSGWNLLQAGSLSDTAYATYWKVASSEPTSYTFNWTGSTDRNSVMIGRYSLANIANPINAYGLKFLDQYDSTIECQDITTTNDSCLIVLIAAGASWDVTASAPSGFAHRGSVGVGFSNGSSVHFADKVQELAGNTNENIYTFNKPIYGKHAGWTVALNPQAVEPTRRTLQLENRLNTRLRTHL